MDVAGYTAKDRGCQVAMARSRREGGRHSVLKRALAWSTAWCIVALGLAALAQVSPLPVQARDWALDAILFPLSFIAAGITALVDLFGPIGRAEPASSYLSRSWVNALVVIAFVIYAGLIFLLALGLASWRRRRQRPEGPGETNETALC